MTELQTRPATIAYLRILRDVAQDLRVEGRSAARCALQIVERLEAGFRSLGPIRLALRLAECSAEAGSATEEHKPGVERDFELCHGKAGAFEIASSRVVLAGDPELESFADVLEEMLVSWWKQRQCALQLDTVRSTLNVETEAHRFDLARIAKYQQQLRRLAADLALAEDRERREIAAKMHDCLVFELRSIQGEVDLLRQEPALREFERHLSKTAQLCAEALDCTRTLSTEISPPVLHEHGLASALGWLGEQFEHKHDLQVDVQVGRIDPLPEELRIFLFQAARELLTNVVKHADTRRARVRGKREGGWIWIEVSDRGCGSSARSRRESGGELGFGLFSIRERSSYFGGQFELESESNRGTRARVRLPLRARAS